MNKFEKILCVINSDNDSEVTIKQAAKIASDHQSTISFTIILNDSNSKKLLPFFEEKKENYLKEMRHHWALTIKNHQLLCSLPYVPTLNVYYEADFIEIIKSVIKNNYDLVVKCADSASWINRLFGSNDMNLLRKCPCPVLMLKPEQHDDFKNILATVDVNEDVDDSMEGKIKSELNNKVLNYSANMCMSDLVELHIGSVWDAYGESFYRNSGFSPVPSDVVDKYVADVKQNCKLKLDQYIENLKGFLGDHSYNFLMPHVHLVKGKPSIEIPLLVEKIDIDLVVMGTVGRIGVPGLIIGNTAELILEQIQCSVLAIKPDGYKSPVDV